MKYVLCYDIQNIRRLRRVSKIMEGYGYRVQKSVFEAFLNEKDLAEIKKRLLAEINAEEDTVRFFRLCEACDRAVIILGTGDRIKREPFIIL